MHGKIWQNEPEAVMRFSEAKSEVSNDIDINTTCPYCKKGVSLLALENIDDISGAVNGVSSFMCIRQCPLCEGMCVAFLQGNKKLLIKELWPQSIHRDYKEAGKVISESLDRAIFNSEQGYYDAAAIMLRKAVEQICDKEGAPEEGMLGNKITALEKHLILPKDIISGMRNLSYLGNDAAHVQSRVFDNVGKEEVEVGIELTIEIIRALYHYRALVKRLDGLKKSAKADKQLSGEADG